MATVDWKALVAGVAPILGTALGGPLGGVAGSLVGQALGLGAGASTTAIASTLSNGLMTGDQIVALRKAEDDFKADMASKQIDILKINADTEQAYITDTASARTTFGQDDKVFWLGIVVLGTFAAIMVAVLYGLYAMITGKFEVSASTIGVASGLVGSIVGYLASNAQQVVNYFFGSSKGSKDAATSLQTALTTSMQQTTAAVNTSTPQLIKMPDGTYATNQGSS